MATSSRPAQDALGATESTIDAARTPPLRVLVVDDHEVVRGGIVAMLQRNPRFQVVAQAGTATEALDQARRFEPELVLMDVQMPDRSGLEACLEIRAEFPTMRVVFLTASGDDEMLFAAILAGASGYVLKQSPASEFLAALEAAGKGDSLLDSAVTERVLERIRRLARGPVRDELDDLTAQERRILLLVAEGKTNHEIAAEVFLSEKTVKNYVSSILKKLHLEHRAQTPSFLARQGRTLDR